MKQIHSSKKRLLCLPLALCALLCLLTLVVSAQSVGTVKVKQTAKTTRSVTISWSYSGSVTGCELLQYNKQTKKYDSIGQTTKTAYTLKKLEPGDEYVLALRPLLIVGGKTTQGKLVKIRVYTTVNAVPKITQSETTENSHKLNWKTINGAEKYEVYYYNENDKKFNLLGETANNYVKMVNLKPAMLYKYRVRAISVASDGTRVKGAASKTFTAYTIPGAIKNVKTFDLTSTGYRLQWDAAAGANGYIVTRFSEETGKFEEVTKTATPTLIVRELQPGTTSYYKICAYATLQNVNRKGTETNALAVTTKPLTVAPKFVSGDPARAKIKIKWTPNEKCDGYRIFVTETEDKDLTMVEEVPLATAKTIVIKLPKKCSKTYIYMQTYIVTDHGRVYSDYSAPLAVSTPPAEPTTAKGK